MKKRLQAYLRFCFLLTAIFLCHLIGKAQKSQIDLVQLSGMVVETDSLKGMPFATIMVKHTKHGTVADFRGYFSFVAQKGDTLIFSELGYIRAAFVIPDTLTTSRYALIQMLHKDTHEKNTMLCLW